MTTMPNDIGNMAEVLTSLSQQTLTPDAIYINVPFVNNRTGEKYVIPEFLLTWPNVHVNRVERDFGPLTKLLPSLQLESDPSTIVITVDDDKIYPKDVLKHLAWYSEQDSSAAWGIGGWSFMWVPEPQGVATIYTSWWMRRNGRAVDVLQAAAGIAYRRKFFPDLTKLSNPPKNCFTTDDMWISGYLATISNVPRLLTPGPLLAYFSLETSDTEWLKHERKNRLSDTNKRVGKDYGCIVAVEDTLGPWRTRTASSRTL
jgi:hypothetical protein